VKKTTENKITTQQCLLTTQRSDCMITSKQNMRVMHSRPTSYNATNKEVNDKQKQIKNSKIQKF